MAPRGDVAIFDRFARVYDLLMPSADRSVLADGLALADRDVERVLDVGGGTGRAARSLGTPERVVVDASAGMLAQARANGLAAVRADAPRLPFADGSVDAVLVVDALHHIGDRRGTIEEAARVLRPGGVLVIREFDPGTLLGRALVAGEHLFGFDSTFLRPDDLAELVADAGLEPNVVDRGFGYTVAGVRTPGEP